MKSAKKQPVKTEWNDMLEHQLDDMQLQLKEIAKTVAYLRAAKYYKVTPEHLTVLVAADYQKKLKLIEKVAVWVRNKGGTFTVGKKHEDGTIYSWKAKFQLDSKTVLLFDIGRYHGADIYDKALDFEALLIRNKTRSVRHFVENDQETHDLVSTASLNVWYKKALKEHKTLWPAVASKK